MISRRERRETGAECKMTIILAVILPAAAISTTAFHSLYSGGPLLQRLPPPSSCPPAFRLNNHHLISAAPPSSQWSRLFLTPSPEQGVSGRRQTFSQSIESLLEAGKIDEAVSELRNQEQEVAASTYHAVIEACCSGGFDPNQGGRQQNRGKMIKGNDRIDVAVDLLHSMNNVTAHAYEIITSGYARRGRWSDAVKTLTAMEELSISSDTSEAGNKESAGPSLNVYQTVLVACARGGQYDLMMSLLTRMRRRGVRPTVLLYNTLLNICAKEKVARWKEALSLLSQCQREPGINPDLVTYTTAMRACTRGRKSDKALKIYRVVKDMGVKLDVYCYTTAMDACAKGRMWKTALSILDEMKENGIDPNEVTYGVAVAACGNGGQWERALELLEEMRKIKMKINTITYNSAISALAKAASTESKQQRRFDSRQKPGANAITQEQSNSPDADFFWRKTLDLIDCMEKEGVERDSFTFSSAISTCGAAGRWEEAVNLIKAMNTVGGRRIKPNRFAYTSAITACGSSGQWEPALELFNDMKQDGLQPDLISYNALIGAGMTANQPEKVFELWQDMCQPSTEEISPDIVTLTEVIATLDRAMGKINRDRADTVFAVAVKRGIILREDSLDSPWEMDLSGMSFPVARAACRFIFRRLVETAKNETVKDLSLITGASRMREHVREVLRDELKPAVYCTVPNSHQGTLLVKEKLVQNYIDGQSKS